MMWSSFRGLKSDIKANYGECSGGLKDSQHIPMGRLAGFRSRSYLYIRGLGESSHSVFDFPIIHFTGLV